ncbi:Exostosin family protein [Klebsormidium nitens]|uniref:Exostosin family protein n=1 Tax=Klebsormidium nitens TaxID=105231 RepID=A0A1Y1IMP9_KLENI|nr:Exostosin family protein [Klebsormidium nitens]|eukprot:GAQ89398.1 Exostosin family protein [Klebsormidium nitens]
MLVSLPPLWGCFNGGFLGVNGTALICRSTNRVQQPRELAFAVHKRQKLANKTPYGGSSDDALLGEAEADRNQSSETPVNETHALDIELGGAEVTEHGGNNSGGSHALHNETRVETQVVPSEEGTRGVAERGTPETVEAETQQACANGGDTDAPGCSEAGSASEGAGSLDDKNGEGAAGDGVLQEELQNKLGDVLGSEDEKAPEIRDERRSEEGTGEVGKEEGPKREAVGGLGAASSAELSEGGAQPVRPDPSCRSDELVYVYDLPSEFHTDVLSLSCAGSSFWSQHPRNACTVYAPELGGIGPRLTGSEVALLEEMGSPVNSWADTGQFALEVMFHQYMRDSYPCRTLDGNEAAAFYVPIYTGMLHHNRTLHCDRATCPEYSPLGLVGRLLGAHLNKLPYLRRNKGRDHITTMGHVNFDGLQDDTCCTNGLLKTKHTKNFVIMGIESSVFTGPERQVSIPYPTCFHPGSPEDITAHQQLIQSSNRTNLASFAGQLNREGLHWGRNLRAKIAEQCELHPGDCHLVECGMECPCTKVLEAQLAAKFCLQPSGDSPTRRSLFDSLQAGCIPVLFHRASAYDEYTSFLPQDESSYSVFIPENDVMQGGVDIIEELRRIPEDELQRKRDVIASMLPSISYEDHERARAQARSAAAALESADSKPRNPLGVGSAYEVALAEALRRVERALETPS